MQHRYQKSSKTNAKTGSEKYHAHHQTSCFSWCVKAWEFIVKTMAFKRFAGCVRKRKMYRHTINSVTNIHLKIDWKSMKHQCSKKWCKNIEHHQKWVSKGNPKPYKLLQNIGVKHMKVYARQQPRCNPVRGGGGYRSTKSDNRETKGATHGRETLTAVYPSGVGGYIFKYYIQTSPP